MQRVAAVKSVALEKPQDDMRGPESVESVERVWSDEVDGAWAPGKAPVLLLTALLRHVEDGDVPQAELVAHEILESEPGNRLVRDLLVAMKQREEMEEALESESESESGEDEDADDDDGDDDEEEDEDDEEDDEDDDSSEANDARGGEEK